MSEENTAQAIIVIPCFNEERRLDLFKESFPKSDLGEIHFIFVDDGSTDNTKQKLATIKDLSPTTISFFSLEKNRGKGEAVRRGLLQAIEKCPTFVGYFDADLATPLSDLKNMINLAQQSTYKVFLGSRVKLLGRTIERRLRRHLMGRVFATGVSVLLDMPVYDTQCGCKLFVNSPALKRAIEVPFRTRWIFDVEIIARLLFPNKGDEATLKIEDFVEIPLYQWRDVSGSKLTLVEFWRFAFEFVVLAADVLKRKSYLR